MEGAVVPLGLQAEGIVRCKSAPEKSPFFKEGDELWDLTGIHGEYLPNPQISEFPSDSDNLQDSRKALKDILSTTNPPLEWAVWNASSGRLVTKSERIAIWQLNQQLGMDRFPKQCRMTAEFFEVPSEGSPLAENAVPSAVVSWVSRSGNEFEAFQQNEGGMIRAKGVAVIGEGAPVVDVAVDVDCALTNELPLKFKTALTLHSDKPFWVVRDFDGKKGLDVRISCAIELVGGTPVREAVLIQKDEIFTPLTVNRAVMEKHRIGDKGWLVIQWWKLEDLSQFSPGDPFADPYSANPFADSDLKNRLGLVNVRAPELLKSWLPNPVWDIGKLIAISGITSDGASGFSGYDPSAQRIFFFSSKESEVDKFEQVLSPGCQLPSKVLICSLGGEGQMRLAGRSGGQSRLERADADQKVIRLLEVEPTIGESGDLIDVHLDYRDDSNVVRKLSVETAVTLLEGQDLEVVTGSSHQGRKSSLRLKTEISEIAP